MTTTRIVRLTSGEEILCDLEETPTSYIILKPTVIIPTQGRNIGLAPWIPYVKNERVEVRRESVLFIVDPVPELADQYNQIHSNLVLPPMKKIIAPGGLS